GPGTGHSDGQAGRSSKTSGNFASASEAWDQLVGEFQKYINSDKANETYSNVKNKFENQKYASQVFGSLEKAFDSVKNSNIDSMFSSGGKNRLIETVDDEIGRASCRERDRKMNKPPRPRNTYITNG